MSQTKAELIDGKGDVVLDTDTLAVDATNNRVGVGTTSPTRQLTVQNAANANLCIKSGNSNASQLMFGDTDSDVPGVIYYNHSDNDLVFEVNTGERMRVDSDGRLLVGTSSSSVNASMVLEGDSGSATGASQIYLQRGQTAGFIGEGDPLGVINFADNTGGRFARIEAEVDGTESGSDYPGRLVFSTTADDASTPTERMRISSDGNVSITDGNLVFAAGHGIDFSATNDGTGASNISELFHDYEEGEFTPVFRGATTAGTYTGTFNGEYTRIGNRVFVDIRMSNIDSADPGSGSTRIAGLPFPCSSVGSGSTGTIRYDSWDVNDTSDGLVPIIGNGNDYLQLYEVGDDRGDSATNVGDVTLNGTDIFISIAYQV